MIAIPIVPDVTDGQCVQSVEETLPVPPEQTGNVETVEDDASKVAGLVAEQNNPLMKLLSSYVTQANEKPEHFRRPQPISPTGSPTWKSYFTELKPAHPLSASKTHKCVAKLANGCMCGAFIAVNFSTSKRDFTKRGYKSEKAVAHLLTCNHQGTEVSALFEPKKHGNIHRNGNMSRFLSVGSSSKVGTPAECKLTQLEFYLYSPGVHPKATFSCTFFKTMLRTIHGDAAILQEKDIQGMVAEEFKLFLKFLQFVVSQLYDRHGGNPFATLGHDDVTLGNKVKYTASDLQLMFDSKNWHLALSFQPSEGGAASVMAGQLDSLILERTKLHRSKVVKNVVSDLAAIKVAKVMGEDLEKCMMHQADKIAKSATGLLVRTENKEEVNPFQECKHLIEANHALSKYFSWGTRRAQLKEFFRKTMCVQFFPRLPVSTTRMASQHDCLNRNLVSKKTLDLFVNTVSQERTAQAKEVAKLQMTNEQWQSTAEVESVLNTIKGVIGLSQFEGIFAAFKHYLTRQLKADLKEGSGFDVIKSSDVDENTKATDPPREHVEDKDATHIGLETRKRALLEAEARFPSFICDNDLILILLDLRGADDCLTDEEMQRAVLLLKAAYVKYAKTHAAFTREKLSAGGGSMAQLVQVKQEAVAVSATASCTQSSPPSNQVHASAVARDIRLNIQKRKRRSTPTFAPRRKTNSGGVVVVTEDQQFAAEFDRVFPQYRAIVIDWIKSFPGDFPNPAEGSEEVALTNEDLTPDDKMKLDYGKVMKAVSGEVNSFHKYGHLPAMAETMLGSPLAASYNERMNSVAKQLMPPYRTRIGYEEFEMCVVLRMNRDFMAYMRDQHPELLCDKVETQRTEPRMLQPTLAGIFKTPTKGTSASSSLQPSTPTL